MTRRLQGKANPGEMKAEMGPTPSIGLTIRRGEVAYFATLEAPAFGALPSEGRIYKAIYESFAKHGAKLADIRVEGVVMSPGDASVICSLPLAGALVRYRLERVEVWWDGLRLLSFPALAEDAIRALREVHAEPAIATHAVHVTFHAETGGELGAWFSAYIPRAPHLDANFSPTGVAFSCPLEDGGRGSFLVERSLIVTEGASVRTTCEYPGTLSERVVCDRATDFLAMALGKFGMLVNEPPKAPAS